MRYVLQSAMTVLLMGITALSLIAAQPTAADRSAAASDDPPASGSATEQSQQATDAEEVAPEGEDEANEEDPSAESQITPFIEPRFNAERDLPVGSAGAITDLDVREILAVLEDINPALARRLRLVLRSNPRQARQMVAGARDRIRDVIEARRQDPRLYELRVRDFRLTQRTRIIANRVRQIEESGDARAFNQAKVRLRQLLVEHFRVRQALRELELKRLEERISHMREQLEAHAQAREALIDRHLEELLTSDAPPPPPSARPAPARPPVRR